MKNWIVIILCLAFGIGGFAQSADMDYVVVEEIEIVGNKRTKKEIILREMTFAACDTILISNLTKQLRRSQELIINMGLFTRVNVVLKNWIAQSNHIAVKVEILEAWPIYPFPIFELADRNFNIWWVEQQRSFKRVKYGLDFSHNNLTGRKDRLELRTEQGYGQLYALRYRYPYLNRKRTWGLDVSIKHEQRKEIDYNTSLNKQLFYSAKDASFVFRWFETKASFSHRPKYNWTHAWTLGYANKRISTQVIDELNLKYFSSGRTQEQSINLSYKAIHDKRDIKAYPLNGFYTELELTKLGLGFFNHRNVLAFDFVFDQYFTWNDQWGIGLEAIGKVNLIRQPISYHESKIMGYSRNTLHGYEYYILNGLDMGILKTFFRKKLVDFELRLGKFMPIEALRNTPIKIYGRLNSDYGYANDPYQGGNNFLNQQLLWGGGPSLDFVFYYDIVVRLEYSFNNLGERGFFLHFDFGI